MNIIFPVLQFDRTGGYRVISRLATEWQRMGHNVIIAAYESSDKPYFPTEARVIWYNSSGSIEESNNLEKKFKLFDALVGMLRLLSSREYRNFIMIATLNITAFPVFFSSGKKSNRYYYIQAYEPEYYSFSTIKGLIYKTLASLSYILPLKQIANSQTYIGYKFVRASVFCPPGIDLDVFYPREMENGQKNRTVIGFIGRSEPSKGTSYILDALRMVDSDRYVIRSVFANGISESDAKLMKIDVVDVQNDSELSDFYRSVDILITAVVDQLGAPHMPCYEALATGTSLISTGHLPADSSCAWIIPPRDSQAILDALNEIQNRPDISYQKTLKGLNKVQSYQWKAIAQKFLSLL